MASSIAEPRIWRRASFRGQPFSPETRLRMRRAGKKPLSREGVMVVSSTTSSVVKLGSHLDVRNVGLARQALHTVIETATGDVVVDMANLEAIDAAGLGMITAVHLRCE